MYVADSKTNLSQPLFLPRHQRYKSWNNVGFKVIACILSIELLFQKFKSSRGAELLEELNLEELKHKNIEKANTLEVIRLKMERIKETYKGYAENDEPTLHSDGKLY